MTQHYAGIAAEVVLNLLGGHYFNKVDLDSQLSVKKKTGFITYSHEESKYLIEDQRLNVAISLPEYIFSDGIAQTTVVAAKDVAFQLNKIFSIVESVVSNSIRDNQMNKQRCIRDISAKINEYDNSKLERLDVIKQLSLKTGTIINIGANGTESFAVVDAINFDYTIVATRGKGSKIEQRLNDFDPTKLRQNNKLSGVKDSKHKNEDLFGGQISNGDKDILIVAPVPSREIDRRKAEEIAVLINGILKENLIIPTGHQYSFDIKDETTWSNSGPGDHISAYIRKIERDNSFLTLPAQYFLRTKEVNSRVTSVLI
jgi:hypothetical protein